MKLIYFILCFLLSINLYAVEKLTLNEAIETALKNNYSINIVQNDFEIDKNNLTIGNAGYLPTIDINAVQNYSLNNSDKTYQSGDRKITNGATANALNASVALSWTIFDGFKMFINYEKLKELESLGQLKMKNGIESVIAEVMKLYCLIVSQQGIVNVSKESIKISEERLKIANDKYTLGAISKSEWLQAKVDLNSDLSNMKIQESVLTNLKIELYELMGSESFTTFDVDEDIIIIQDISIDSLITSAIGNNLELRLSRKSKVTSELNTSVSQSKQYPKLALFGNYQYTNSVDNAGFMYKNLNHAYIFGINLTYNLFDGWNTSREIENNKILENIADLQYNQTKNSLMSSIRADFTEYSMNLELLRMEISNLDVATENLNIAKEKLNLGGLSALEFREAQRNYYEAKSRLINAKNSAKQKEIQLLRLSGLILK